MYGATRVERALAHASSARDAIGTIRNGVQSFVDGAAPYDDMTVLAVQWRA
jgi:hypothetical protein